jgi:dipeptidyl aminopeptidase/acylaminoacyl peptidase
LARISHHLYTSLLVLAMLVPSLGFGQADQSIELVVPQKGVFDTGFVSPNGKFLFTFSSNVFGNNPMAVWEIVSGKQVHASASHFMYVQRTFNDSFFIYQQGKEIVIWNTCKGEIQHILRPGFTPNGFGLDQTGTKICVMTWSGRAYFSQIYSLKTGKSLFLATGMQYYRDNQGNWLVIKNGDSLKIYSWDESVILRRYHEDSTKFTEDLDSVNNQFERTVPFTEYVQRHKLSLQFKRLAVDKNTLVDNTEVTLLNQETGRVKQIFKGSSNGIKVAVINRDGSTLVTTHKGHTKVWDFKTGAFLRSLKYPNPDSTGVYIEGYLSDISSNGDYIVLDGDKVFNARNGNYLHSLNVPQSKYNSEISGNNKWIVIAGKDSNAYLFSPSSGKLLHTINTESRVSDCVFSPNSKYVAVSSNGFTTVLEISSQKIVASFDHGAKWDSGTFLSFSPEGDILIIGTRNQDNKDNSPVKVFHVASKLLLAEINIEPLGIVYSPDGRHVLFNYSTGNRRERFSVYRTSDWKFSFSSGDMKIGPSNAIVFSANGKYIRAFNGKTAYIWDLESKTIKHRLTGHTGVISLAVFSTDGDFVLTTGEDHVRLWQTESGKEMLRLYTFDGGDFIHIHPSGLFDGSPGALEKVYFRRGSEIIDLAQLKDRYYEPGIWEKVIKGEKLRDVRGLNQLKLEPQIKLLEVKRGILPIQLTKRDGGYGRVSVFINGKEIVADARSRGFDSSKSDQLIKVKIENHPFLIPGGENSIEVKTWSADGFVESRGARSVFKDTRPTTTKVPSFYGVICGVSEYHNDQLNLAFSITDALAMSAAVKKGSENLFGKNNTHIYTLTSPGTLLPTKSNLENVFASIRDSANPEDVVFVYLSGHGIVWGGETGDFYYLTPDAYSLNGETYNDPLLRSKNTVSTAEFTKWINSISALKQVMIIDACGSGKAVDNLMASRSVNPSQIRAIDRMKDRTGMFVISGCAADAVSYESSRYGQGLLTYSLLQGMKGAALKENKFIDIDVLMNHAREEVPKMANGIGGIQTPQVLVPKSGSFDIGLLRDSDKAAIMLASPKPVFIRSLFINATAKRDRSGLSRTINDMLSEEAAKGASAIFLYFDADEYDDGYSMSGDYMLTDTGVDAEVVISKGYDEVHRFKMSAENIEDLADRILITLKSLSLK